MGLVCTCLGFPGADSVWRGLRALVSAPHVCPLRHRVYMHLFHLTAFILCDVGYLLFFQLCLEGCVHCPSLYASPLSGTPVPPFALTVSVCSITLSCLSLPSVLQGCVHWLGLDAPPPSVP